MKKIRDLERAHFGTVQKGIIFGRLRDTGADPWFSTSNWLISQYAATPQTTVRGTPPENIEALSARDLGCKGRKKGTSPLKSVGGHHRRGVGSEPQPYYRATSAASE